MGLLKRRRLRHYDIDPSVAIGKGFTATCETLVVGRGVNLAGAITGPCRVEIGADSSFQGRIMCRDWAGDDYPKQCILGERVSVGAHFFDVVGGLYVGEGTWFAGRDSQVWTHGLGRGGPVRIGDNCYIGSAVRIAPGVTLAGRTFVALGSVVASSVEESGCLVAGNPARIVQRDYEPILGWRG